jgi:hypothetical protein
MAFEIRRTIEASRPAKKVAEDWDDEDWDD